MNKVLFLSFLSVTLSSTAIAQQYDNTQNQVEAEFTKLIETSNDYQGYKVVDYNELVNLKNSTIRNFSDLNDEIITQRNTIEQQQEQINRLREELETTQRDLQQVNEEKDAITFLGMPFTKSNYKTVMWVIVGILVLALILFIYKYKQSHGQTKEAREKLDETEKEFAAYREKALEKEQRLGRMLQDERNKNSER